MEREDTYWVLTPIFGSVFLLGLQRTTYWEINSHPEIQERNGFWIRKEKEEGELVGRSVLLQDLCHSLFLVSSAGARSRPSGMQGPELLEGLVCRDNSLCPQQTPCYKPLRLLLYTLSCMKFLREYFRRRNSSRTKTCFQEVHFSWCWLDLVILHLTKNHASIILISQPFPVFCKL